LTTLAPTYTCAAIALAEMDNPDKDLLDWLLGHIALNFNGEAHLKALKKVTKDQRYNLLDKVLETLFDISIFHNNSPHYLKILEDHFFGDNHGDDLFVLQQLAKYSKGSGQSFNVMFSIPLVLSKKDSSVYSAKGSPQPTRSYEHCFEDVSIIATGPAVISLNLPHLISCTLDPVLKLHAEFLKSLISILTMVHPGTELIKSIEKIVCKESRYVITMVNNALDYDESEVGLNDPEMWTCHFALLATGNAKQRFRQLLQTDFLPGLVSYIHNICEPDDAQIIELLFELLKVDNYNAVLFCSELDKLIHNYRNEGLREHIVENAKNAEYTRNDIHMMTKEGIKPTKVPHEVVSVLCKLSDLEQKLTYLTDEHLVKAHNQILQVLIKQYVKEGKPTWMVSEKCREILKNSNYPEAQFASEYFFSS
jgi:hypothetical protein